jgi:hypothetical protein
MFSSPFWKSTEEVSAQNEPRRFWCKKVHEDKSAMQLDAGPEARPGPTAAHGEAHQHQLQHQRDDLEKRRDRKIKALELSLARTCTCAQFCKSASTDALLLLLCNLPTDSQARPEVWHRQAASLHDLCRNK